MLPKVYKYRPIDNHTKELLEQNTIYFPKPSNLNDPFECKAEYVAKANPIRRFIHFYRHAVNDKNCKTLSDRVRFALMSLKPHFSKEREQRAIGKANEWHRKKINNAGILTFTEKNDDTLMWSHYADNHKGVCLEFDFNGDSTFGEDRFWKVRYRRSYLPANFYSSDPDRKFKRICMTKAYTWRYEKERRLVWEEGCKTYPFDPESLTGLIFGCRVEEDKRQAIIETLRMRKSHVNIYDAKMDVHKYKIEIVESIDNGD